MNIISFFDLISILAVTLSIFWIAKSGKVHIYKDTRLLIIALCIVTMAYESFMIVEWLGINHHLNSFEDMVGAMIPLMWAFIFYSFFQHDINKDIRINEENLRITLNSIGDAVIATDTRGRITRMNPVAENLTGWSFQESKGLKLQEVFRTISSGSRKKLKDPVDYVLETGKTLSHSQQPILIAKDGREYHISDSASAIFNTEGEITGVVLVFSDGTQNYLQSEKLRESEERLNLALQGTCAGLWDWDIRTGKLVCNKQWANMIGYELKELEPLSAETWEKLTNPEDVIKSDEIIDKHFRGLIDTYECETRMKHKDGHWVWVLDRGMLVERDKNGNPARMIGTHIDISKQKNIELELKAQMDQNLALNEKYQFQNQELRRSIDRIQKINEEFQVSRQKAEESDRLKSAFLANMSHEIRTPMNGIIGFSEMMSNPKLDDGHRAEYAKIVIDSGRQLLAIVNDILDISRIEAGLVVLTREEVSINELLRVLLVFFEPQVRHKDITIQVYKPLSDQESVTITDHMRLRQILIKLLSNAIKFTPEGKIEFGYTKVDGSLEFFVRDTGIGIPVELHEKIFEAFHQAEIDMSYHHGGTGLGLSISRKLTEMLGGKIWLESKPDKGSVFYFTIPYHPVGKKKKPETHPERKQSKDASEHVILIAEDDDTNYLFLEAALTRANVKILRARNGLQAIELCKKNSAIQVVLMDIKMPLMNGYEATRKIKQLRPALPVIAQTAYAMNEDKKKALDSGCDEYISKPIRMADLIAIVGKYLI